MADTQETTPTTTEAPEVVETTKAEETPKAVEETKEETNGSADGDAKNGDSKNGRTNGEAKNGEEGKEEVLKMEKIAPVPVVIFYDLETTGFNYKNNHKDEQILSIGAVNGKTGDEYHKVIFFQFCEQYVFLTLPNFMNSTWYLLAKYLRMLPELTILKDPAMDWLFEGFQSRLANRKKF